MDLRFSPEEARFKAEVQTFLEPYSHLGQFFHHDDAAMEPLFLALAERNWLALSWPKEVGGEGLPAAFEFILWDEMARRRIARPPMSAGIVAKTIIRCGDETQKAYWLPQIRKGASHFALGYSEPESGSDLASVSTRAERRDDVYVVNGSKCWNTAAHTAHHIWLLVRTGEQGSRGRGLSLLIVDTNSPGLRIQPLNVMGGHVFTTLDFSGVEVPVERRIGPENGAWAIMGASLADERVVQFPPQRIRRDYDDVAAFAHEQGLDDDPVVQARLADMALDVLACQAQVWRVMEAAGRGGKAAVESAANKLTYTQATQNIARVAMEFGCPAAVLAGSAPEEQWQASMIESIGGGTSEIMTSIIARQALGLG